MHNKSLWNGEEESFLRIVPREKAVTAHQGIAGSDKCHAEALFTTESKTITTGFDQIPYVKSSDSNGMVANGGECTATLYVSGMGEQIIRAELYL